MRTLVAGLVIGAAVGIAGVGAGVRWAGGGQPGPAGRDRQLIQVVGEARLPGEPEVAHLRFGLQQQSQTVGEGERKMMADVEALTKAAQGLGVRAEEVSLENLSADQRWNFAKGPGVANGFTVTGMLTIVVRDTKRVSRIIDAVFAAGATRLQGVTYQADRAAWRAEALQEALKQAQAKAEAMAEGMGKPLGRLVLAQETDAPGQLVEGGTRWASYPGAAMYSAMPSYYLPNRPGRWVYVVVQYEI